MKWAAFVSSQTGDCDHLDHQLQTRHFFLAPETDWSISTIHYLKFSLVNRIIQVEDSMPLAMFLLTLQSRLCDWPPFSPAPASLIKTGLNDLLHLKTDIFTSDYTKI